MPRVLTNDDLKDLQKKGRLPIGEGGGRIAPIKEVVEPEKVQEDVEYLAEVARKSVEQAGRALQINADLVQMVVSKLTAIKEVPITVNVPAQETWAEVDVEVTERDFNGNIRKIRMKRVS